MKSLSFLVVTLALAFLPLVPSSLAGEMADRIVAFVGNRVVTSSDIELENAISPYMSCPEKVLCDPHFDALERLLNLAVIHELAGDASIYKPSNEDVEHRLRVFLGRWPSTDDLHRMFRRFGLDEDSMAAFLYSRMVAEHYVNRIIRLPLFMSSGEDGISYQAYLERYIEWITLQRKTAPIRYVEPLLQEATSHRDD